MVIIFNFRNYFGPINLNWLWFCTCWLVLNLNTHYYRYGVPKLIEHSNNLSSQAILLLKNLICPFWFWSTCHSHLSIYPFTVWLSTSITWSYAYMRIIPCTFYLPRFDISSNTYCSPSMTNHTGVCTASPLFLYVSILMYFWFKNCDMLLLLFLLIFMA